MQPPCTDQGLFLLARLTKSAFDSNGDVVHSILHGLTALGHQLGLQHHGGSEATGPSHSLTGTPTVEVDLVIAILGNYLGSCCQGFGVAAPQLTDDGVLLWREPQESAESDNLAAWEEQRQTLCGSNMGGSTSHW